MESTDKNQSARSTTTLSEPAKKWYENKKTKIAIISLVLLVVVLVICSYFVSTKSNQPIATNFPLANQSQNQEWLTYKNDELGFSIDYPKDWGFGNNALGGTTSSETNFIFCPPENKDLTDSGEACKLEDNSPHMPDYQSPIIYLFSYKQGEYNGDINGEGVRLSPDGKYVYELSPDGDIDGDTYKRMLSSFKFKEKSEIGEIVWTEAKKLDDLKIFVPFVTDPPYSDIGPGFKAYDATYYLVGRVNSGKYAGADVITALRGNGDYYTVLRRDNKFTILSKYQTPGVDPVSSGDFATTPLIDEDYAIAELDYPDKIDSPTQGVYYNNPNSAMSLDPNVLYPPADKKLSTDAKWGTIYGIEKRQIDILLPNGLEVSYYLADVANPESISFSNGQTLSNYEAITDNGCDNVWNEEDHSAYYATTNLQQVGNIYGLPVYEMTNKTLIKTLYADMDGGKATPAYLGIKDVSLKTFTADHPMLIWTDPYGRKLSIMNKKYSECLRGMGKPVIYLYPEKEEKVSVKVQTPGPMTASIPDYNDGWNVSARPDGTLTEITTGKEYPYLFWESKGGNGYSMPKEGFNVAVKDLHTFFESALAKYGLSGKERADFEEFWIPRLESKRSPYYFITFTTTEGMQRYAPLAINPQPDTLIRVFMDYKLISNPVPAKEPQITMPSRNGFTAIEWGGALK